MCVLVRYGCVYVRGVWVCGCVDLDVCLFLYPVYKRDLCIACSIIWQFSSNDIPYFSFLPNISSNTYILVATMTTKAKKKQINMVSNFMSNRIYIAVAHYSGKVILFSYWQVKNWIFVCFIKEGHFFIDHFEIINLFWTRTIFLNVVIL